MQRTYVFIDAQNLHLGVKSLGWSLDYGRFIVHLKDTYNAEKVFMYLGYIEEYKELYKDLRSFGYELVFKDILRFGKRVKGNVDILLTVDVIRKKSEYDKAIIVSADGDFSSLYEYLEKDLDKVLRIIVPNKKRYSHLLRKYYRKLIFINGLKAKLKKRRAYK